MNTTTYAYHPRSLDADRVRETIIEAIAKWVAAELRAAPASYTDETGAVDARLLASAADRLLLHHEGEPTAIAIEGVSRAYHNDPGDRIWTSVLAWAIEGGQS